MRAGDSHPLTVSQELSAHRAWHAPNPKSELGRQLKWSTLFIIMVAAVAFTTSLFAEAVPPSRSSWGQKNTWSSTEPSSSRLSRDFGRKRNRPRRNISPFSPESHNVALDVGQVFLMGDLSDSYDDNIGGRLSYTYGVSDMFGFNSSLGYSSHSDGDLSMTTLLVGLRTNLSWYDKIIPHAVFGLGFYKPSYTITKNPDTSLSPVLFGLHFGPGVDLQLNEKLYFGTNLTFHSIFGANKATKSGKVIDVGGAFTSFLLHAGVTF